MLKRIKIVSIAFFVILGSFVCQAQDTNKPASPWQYKAGLGFSYFEGNVEKLDSRANFGISRRDSAVEYDASYQFIYGEFNGDKNNLLHDFTLTTDFIPFSTYSPFAGVFVYSNIYKGFRLRNSYLAGVKRKLFSNAKDDISLSAALMYDFIQYGSANQEANEPNIEDEILRFSLRPKLKFYISDNVVFKHISFWQPEIENIDNFIFTAETSLDFLLKKNFSFGIDYLYYFNSEPPYNSLRRRDQKVLVSLKYSR